MLLHEVQTGPVPSDPENKLSHPWEAGLAAPPICLHHPWLACPPLTYFL